ncbi:MAG: hypothetical protein AAF702_47645 [Chloroflexota bacterium]
MVKYSQCWLWPLKIWVLVISFLSLIACIPITSEQVDSSQSLTLPIHTTTPIPPQPTEDHIETHVHANWTNVQGRTDDGLAYIGNPDAPVTFIDYSDFL